MSVLALERERREQMGSIEEIFEPFVWEGGCAWEGDFALVRHRFENAPMHHSVVQVLRSIYDPEIALNIYDLGLIYGVESKADQICISLTLTSANCPAAQSMPEQIIDALHANFECFVIVRLYWSPAWSQERVSEEARLELGFM